MPPALRCVAFFVLDNARDHDELADLDRIQKVGVESFLPGLMVTKAAKVGLISMPSFPKN